MRLRERVSVVVVTRNRAESLGRTLRMLRALPDPPAAIVVDDASIDATARIVADEFSDVELVRMDRSHGPVARNHGVRHAQSPYVAFSDDDSWWAAGALERAAEVLDAHPRVAVVAAQILVGEEERIDAICEEMGRSPIPRDALVPGIPVLSFMGGASLVRRSAFEEVGGFEQRLVGGGEEESLGCDLITAGWDLRYVPDVVAHHHPAGGDKSFDRLLGVRNALWFAWRRRPLLSALRWTAHMVRAVPWSRRSLRAFGSALTSLPWVLRTRDVVPPPVEAQFRAVDRQKMNSRARRYE